MARKPEPSGNVRPEWELEKLREREETVLTTSCTFCSWVVSGPMREGREAYAAHRTEHHPEVKPVKRARRRRLFGQITLSQLDDNIANVRKQGGAQWAGPDA